MRRILVGSPNPCWVQGMHYGFGEHMLGSANALWVRRILVGSQGGRNDELIAQECDHQSLRNLACVLMHNNASQMCKKK